MSVGRCIEDGFYVLMMYFVDVLVQPWCLKCAVAKVKGHIIGKRAKQHLNCKFDWGRDALWTEVIRNLLTLHIVPVVDCVKPPREHVGRINLRYEQARNR